MDLKNKSMTYSSEAVPTDESSGVIGKQLKTLSSRLRYKDISRITEN